ncbi:Nonspecific lipid-transfer protein B, putative [Ricinus communis]|nr:Nonspecific lipid-transfer protein B, putative [Ricinus communis]
MMKGAVISVLAAAIILQAMAMQGEAVNCGQVNKALSSCVPFLTGFDTTPSLTCCAGVMELKRLAPTVKDKRIACECVKTAAARYPNIREDAASSLPYKCGVVINVPISKTTNCHE